MARHSILDLQLRRLMPGIDTTAEPLATFLDAIDQTYRGFDDDRLLVERAMELSSDELIRTNAELRGLVQAFPDLILLLDASGRVVDRHGDVSGAFWSANRILGRRLVDLVPPDMIEACTRALGPPEVPRTIRHFELPVGEGRHRRVYEVRLAPLDDEEVLAIVRDMTNARRLEAMRVARDAAESANRAKTAFIASVSHELRTPLNAIIGYSEMLAEDAEPTVREDLVRITTAGRYLQRIVTAVLDIAKIEAGHVAIEVEPIDVVAFVTGLCELARPQAQGGGNQLTTAVVPEAGIIHTDGAKLRQILLNLLSNACHFTQDGHVAFDAQPESRADVSGVRFAVRDTGVGIPEDQLSRLFEKFTQAEDPAKRRPGGTGLSLATSHRLAQLLGGHLGAESSPGEGSIFTLWLPRYAVAASEPSLRSGAAVAQ